jgi:hypothetical protein
MTIDLEEIFERAVPMSGGHYLAVRAEDFNALVAEVEHLRGERAAVVAWMRREITKCGCDDDTAACIERGEHRRKEET